MTSDSDVCGVELDMQMSLPNAALCRLILVVTVALSVRCNYRLGSWAQYLFGDDPVFKEVCLVL